MSDLIPRDKAIECVWKPKVKPDAEIFNALKMAIQSEIEQLPIVTQEPDWISVRDRLPDVRGNFLVVAIEAGKYIHITLSEFSKYFTMTGRRSYWKVTHWMPLPEPPKEG
jgi:hypothetical protein